MAKRIEAWEYGELTLLTVTPRGATDAVTNYRARMGGKEPIHGTDDDKFVVMNAFGAKGWRLKLLDELVASSDHPTSQEPFAELSRLEGLTGSPGTVHSVTRYSMARRTK